MLYWNQKDQIAICDMSTDHIKNALEYLREIKIPQASCKSEVNDANKFISAFERELRLRNARRENQNEVDAPELAKLREDNKNLRAELIRRTDMLNALNQFLTVTVWTLH